MLTGSLICRLLNQFSRCDIPYFHIMTSTCPDIVICVRWQCKLVCVSKAHVIESTQRCPAAPGRLLTAIVILVWFLCTRDHDLGARASQMTSDCEWWQHGDWCCTRRWELIKWKHFPRYWTVVRGINRSQVNSPYKHQWRRALMFSFIWTWIDGWVNKRSAGDLRRNRAHHDVSVMWDEMPMNGRNSKLHRFHHSVRMTTGWSCRITKYFWNDSILENRFKAFGSRILEELAIRMKKSRKYSVNLVVGLYIWFIFL